MPRVRDLLHRFRPAGAPGPAGSAAVPVDHGADRAAELAPVFALLADTERRCTELRERAGRDAEDIRDRARESSRATLADAELRAASERADAAAGVAEEASGDSAATVAAAHRDADRLRDRATERTPRWVGRVVDEVEKVLDAAPGADPR